MKYHLVSDLTEATGDHSDLNHPIDPENLPFADGIVHFGSSSRGYRVNLLMLSSMSKILKEVIDGRIVRSKAEEKNESLIPKSNMLTEVVFSALPRCPEFSHDDEMIEKAFLSMCQFGKLDDRFTRDQGISLLKRLIESEFVDPSALGVESIEELVMVQRQGIEWDDDDLAGFSDMRVSFHDKVYKLHRCVVCTGDRGSEYLRGMVESDLSSSGCLDGMLCGITTEQFETVLDWMYMKRNSTICRFQSFEMGISNYMIGKLLLIPSLCESSLSSIESRLDDRTVHEVYQVLQMFRSRLCADVSFDFVFHPFLLMLQPLMLLKCFELLGLAVASVVPGVGDVGMLPCFSDDSGVDESAGTERINDIVVLLCSASVASMKVDDPLFVDMLIHFFESVLSDCDDSSMATLLRKVNELITRLMGSCWHLSESCMIVLFLWMLHHHRSNEQLELLLRKLNPSRSSDELPAALRSELSSALEIEREVDIEKFLIFGVRTLH